MSELIKNPFQKITENKEALLQKTITFILKLADDPNFPDDEAVKAIVSQLINLKDDHNFVHIMNHLDPESYSSDTKLLSEKGRERLNLALEELGKILKS